MVGKRKSREAKESLRVKSGGEGKERGEGADGDENSEERSERKKERDVPLYERSEFKLLFLLPLWEDEKKEK